MQINLNNEINLIKNDKNNGQKMINSTKLNKD
jgi:hypothetical protein